jgi:glycosyltransferase involved in cell wall biosynthesis
VELLAGRSVAVVHEWYGATGGSEKVFVKMAALVPHAKRYVLWQDRDAVVEGPPLHQSWLARTPLRYAKPAALPVMPLAWRTLSRETFDVVISSSHAFAHTVKLGSPERTRYLSYVHSPARYVWSPGFDGRGSGRLLSLPRRVLQGIDRRLSRHVHSYAANSHEVRRRIERYWHRDAYVINPPVETEFYLGAPAADQQQNRDYLLGVGRWIPYKNFGLMIEIAERAKLPLVLAGSGPQEVALRKQAAAAGVAVTFEVRPSDERLRQLYWGARALLFPVHEDFGIIPVEAQACGTPVIGLRSGGLLETVLDGQSGFLAAGLDPADYAGLTARLGELSPGPVQASAARFTPANFQLSLTKWIENEAAA